MSKELKNISLSVHQRLLNKARQTSRTFNELLQHYAIERFLYRISKSPNSDRFILKGALMFSVWSSLNSRPTMDIDLMGRIDNSLDVIVAAMKDACKTEVENDGMAFDPESVTAVRITEDAEYQGVRVRIQGNLGNARISLQIDIGFGDEVYPHPGKIRYPTLLDFPAPELSGYTMESTIAEKFQAMVKLGILNSRMKDFYDIWLLSKTFNFKGEQLANAIVRTFENRNTQITGTPTFFEPSFAKEKKAQWQGFVRKTKLPDTPELIDDVISDIKIFLEPLIISMAGKRKFQRIWNAPGPWLE
jgi:hypothetical protein